MNRVPLLLAVLALFTLPNLWADAERKPTQVEIVSVLRGFDLASAVGSKLVQESSDQTFSLPKVTTKSGKAAVIRIVREFPYPTDFGAENTPTAFDVSNLGVTLTIKPYIVNGEVNFSGSLLLATAAEKTEVKSKGGDIPTVLTAKKVFSGKARSGERIALIALSPAGDEVTLFLTLMLMDQAGRRVE